MRYMTEEAAEELFNGYVDEMTGDIVIFGTRYRASTVLKEVDPIAYSCCYSDWEDGENITTDPDEKVDEEEEENND